MKYILENDKLKVGVVTLGAELQSIYSKVTEKEYMDKLETFVSSLTNGVKQLNNQYYVKQYFEQAAKYYK